MIDEKKLIEWLEAEKAFHKKLYSCADYHYDMALAYEITIKKIKDGEFNEKSD